MKLKPAFKYQLSDIKRPVAVFYLVIICLLILFFALSYTPVTIITSDSGGEISTSYSNQGSRISGMEFATVIFLFVAGLNSFKEFFRLFMQNGLSRRTMFVSRMITILSVCTFMAIIDKIILLVGKMIGAYQNKFTYAGLFEMIYGIRAGRVSDLHMQADGFFFNLFIYLAAMAFGYFITVAYYRMNKPVKIAVSIGIPMSLLYGLPILDSTVTHGAISSAIGSAVSFAFGFRNNANPYFGMVTLLMVFVVFGALTWLMIKRAVVRD